MNWPILARPLLAGFEVTRDSGRCEEQRHSRLIGEATAVTSSEPSINVEQWKAHWDEAQGNAEWVAFHEGKPVRLEQDGLGIYVWPDGPDWCVPDERGDFILGSFLDTDDERTSAEAYAQRFALEPQRARWHVRRFLDRLKDGSPRPYEGRGAYLELERLGECWLHLTYTLHVRLLPRGGEGDGRGPRRLRG